MPSRKSESTREPKGSESPAEVKKRPALFYGILAVFVVWVGYLVYVIAMF